MKTITIVAIIAAVAIVGAACIGIPLSGVLNGGTTGPGGDDPVVPTEPVEPTPTETPTETPTDSSMSYFSPMTSSSSSSSGSGSSTPVHTHTWGNWVDNEDGTHSRYCTGCDTGVETEDCTFGEWSPEEGLSTHVRLCTVCSYEEREACDSDGCKQSEGETREHTLGACETCGRPAEQTVACLITYTESTGGEPPQHTLKCEVCEKDYGSEACSISTYISNDENPTMVETCENCDYEKSTLVVAKIGDVGYETLEAAIAAVQEGQTIEILRLGTYDPFTIGQNGVTVKGIVGETKEKSTVIKNTATDRIILGKGTITDDKNPTKDEIHALKSVDGVKLENLWIDSTVASNLEEWDLRVAIIITPYYEHADSYATNTIITGCYIEGDDSQIMTFASGDGLTFTNNIVKNFDMALYAETNLVKTHTISGNTFEDVKTAMAYTMTNGGQADITITDNTVVDTTAFNLWDYAQWQKKDSTDSVSSAFKSITVSGNNGDINYVLNHFDYKAETPHTITLGSGTQEMIYMSGVAFDIPYADRANYIIENTDDTALTTATQGRNALAEMITHEGVDKAAVYIIASGDYLLVNTTSQVKYAFTVTDPVAGQQQYVNLDTITISTADELFAFATSVNEDKKTYAGMTVKLMDNIDLENKEWTPIGQTGATQFGGIFDGNEKTISNLKVDRSAITTESDAAGLFGWIEDHSNPVVIKDLTIKNANIKGNHYAGGVVGYITGNNIAHVIQNCHVDGSTITGALIKEQVGGIVGHTNSGEIAGCSVTNTDIYYNAENAETDPDYRYAAAVVGLMQNSATYGEGNTIDNVRINDVETQTEWKRL